jgi:signal peptide peptidase SppA
MPRSSLFRVLAEIHDKPWAITPQALTTIIEIAERENDIEAVAAKLGRPLDNAGNGVEIRHGIAVLAVEGPLFRYANILTDISGASSVQVLATDLQAALDNPNVKQIVLNVNSPGGQIDGIQELADQIREASKAKPVTAYIDGLAASAGYWLAAAAPKIVTAESSLLGSIGVVASLRDNRAAQEKQGVKNYEIVSSKSPYKRPDPATDEGRSQILETVDALADIFIGRVAAFRGFSTAKVERDFGQGKTMVAKAAVTVGMADEVASFEPLVARLAAESSPRAASITVKEKIGMKAQDEEKDCPKCEGTGEVDGKKCSECGGTGKVPANKEDAKTAPPVHAAAVIHAEDLRAPERQRIAAILDAPEAKGRESLARHLALETGMAPDAARKLMASAPTAEAQPADPLAAQMAKLPNPKVGTGEQEQDDEAKEAAKILAFVPQNRRHSAA